MPPTLLGSSAPASTGGTGTGTAGAGPRNAGAGSERRDFDALLKADSGSKTAAPKPAAATAPADGGSPAADDGPPRPDSSEPAPAGDPATTPAGATTDKPAPAEPADDSDAAPWPPLGLAGLALAGLEAVTVMAAPAANTDAPATAKADPLLPALPTAAAAPNAPTGLPATAATATGTAATPVALPLEAEAGADTVLPKAVTEAIAGAGADADGPATPLLHALHSVAELKTAAAAAPFSGDPTAPVQVGGDDFDDAIGARIGWLADQKIGHAVIKVTPHDLGQIEVRLQMDGDKVHASFSSAHAEVRHALETSLPRLRELLGEQGFQLGNADVGQQHTAQDGKAGSGQAGQAGTDADPALADVTVSPSQLMRQRGLVDAYA